MKIYTKESLIQKLREISQRGWIPNARSGNQGGIGNTLEDLLEIEENNLPIPNASEWELKSQRSTTNALTTLFHFEPSPTALKFVPQIFLLNYGWAHKEAGKRYPENERSFRQTINAMSYSDRGFTVKIDRSNRKVLISFDNSRVAEHHAAWLGSVETNIGLGELDPQPYWGFDDLEHKIGTKLLNCFYVQADVKRLDSVEYYWYRHIFMLEKFSFTGFLQGLEEGQVLVDFDARTGHNHGTKFRLRQKFLPRLYANVTRVSDL